jgi:hypothetical protein
MGSHGYAFKVHEATLRLMLTGMTVEQLRQAAHAPRPLILVLEDGTEITGALLFEGYYAQCTDYEGE